MNRYIYHTDPGHGWIAVKVQELFDLGIVEAITEYSFIKGKTAYLEEDYDLSLFADAFQKKHGEMPQYEERYHERTAIRNYPRFSAILAHHAVN